MSNLMAVLLNDVAQLEYDRDKPLPDHQALYLDKMDQKMDLGIDYNGTHIANPDLNQRVQFVAGNLLHSFKENNESMAASLCTYLAIRLPELKQVKIEEQGEQVSIDLVFDEAYEKQVSVKFFH